MAKAPLESFGPIMLGTTDENGMFVASQAVASVDERLSGWVGNIVVSWSQLEQWLDAMTRALLEHRGTQGKAWEKRGAEQRIKLFRKLAEQTFNGHPVLIDEIETLLDRTWKAKRVRDAICHTKIVSHVGLDQPSISFPDSKLGKKSQPFTASDLAGVTQQIGLALATIRNLCAANQFGRLSSDDTSLLQEALNKVRLTPNS